MGQAGRVRLFVPGLILWDSLRMGFTPIQKALVDGQLERAVELYREGNDSLCDLLHYTNNDGRILFAWMLGHTGQLTPTDEPAVGEAITSAHGLRRLWLELQELLDHMPRPLFDGEAARLAYEALGDEVTVYRGDYAEYDSLLWAPSWTLSRDKAAWFTKRSGGVVRTLCVHRDDILAVLFERGEQEVLVDECFTS